MKHLYKYISLLAIVSILALPACKSTRSTNKVQTTATDGGALFMGIYTNIFETNCFVVF